jgi:hypothetical protein
MDLCVPDMAYGINTKLSRRTKLLAKDPVAPSGFAAMQLAGLNGWLTHSDTDLHRNPTALATQAKIVAALT